MKSCADQPAQLNQPFVIFCWERNNFLSGKYPWVSCNVHTSSVTKLTNVAEQAVMDVQCSQSLYNIMFGVHRNGLLQ